MTELARKPHPAQRHSPRAVRDADFPRRLRGLDENEVRAFLETVAGQIEAANDERAKLRAEIERLKRTATPAKQAKGSPPPEINAHAVALFSQAQQVADRLVAEAVQHARDLMANARAQQREILERAHQAASNATGDDQNPAAATHEIEYVRTFARVAQVQLRSVLDALTEEVDKLGQIPHLEEPTGKVLPWDLHTRQEQQVSRPR
ncbi:DivIVA domain-containing protein [Tenggerimyces flavus]|uniref:Cell wall synthesis protein Wag31 n=1 Tax=Tenggerimyces flavus TaxID=1708749 RepID=A0ABV7YAC0_9ACTN|nr:DivIVA domain-containing protein [Tenggerimyces flavus]MBM7783688.1 cell division initiation protein [Tenggerimyces flavus]